MNARPVVSHCRWILIAGSLTFCPLAAFGQDWVPPEALNVKVFPDRYVAAGKPFSDLAALEAWAKAIQIRTLWLDSCGNASTTQLVAAVERFHSIYAQGVQIRTFAAGAPECVGSAEQVGGVRDGVSRALADGAYYATDPYGRSTMP